MICGGKVGVGERPGASVLGWAADEVAAGAKVVAAENLHEGAGRTGPWRLRIEHGGEKSEVVLRVVVPGWIGEDMIAIGAALRFAEERGLAAPRLIASDLDGRKAGEAATLETALPGSSALPAKVSAERLREAGSAIARVHAAPLRPRRDLPLRTRPIQVDDHALERRWASLYWASADGDCHAVVDTLCELTGWRADAAIRR